MVVTDDETESETVPGDCKVISPGPTLQKQWAMQRRHLRVLDSCDKELSCFASCRTFFIGPLILN
jgi:hypothetical protein